MPDGSITRCGPLGELVRGRLERAEGVINVIADQLQSLPLVASTRLRDFC